MAEERIYTIPLRKEFLKAPRYKRTAKAAKALREFLIKHMKSENVKIGKYLNKEIWKHGAKNPPGKVQVKVTKDDDLVKAELINAPVDKEVKGKKEDKKEIKESKEEKEKREILEKGFEKHETKVQKEAEQKMKDEIKHSSLDTKQEQQKAKTQKIISKSQKPIHEKKK